METSELIKKVRRIEIKTKGLSANIFAGQYHSAFKGKGMAFSEVREYQYGDDVRDIDWNVTARYGKPFIKVFEEERELTVMLLIDVSASFSFGSQNIKRDIMTEMAATLAFSAIKNNDKIGVIFFTDKIEKFIPAKKGRKHILFIIRELLGFQPSSNKTDISVALQFLTNVMRRKCTTFMMSDFITTKDYYKPLSIASKKHDLMVLQVYDNLETQLPDVGLMKMQDFETGKDLWVDTSSKRVRDQYKAWWNERQLVNKDNFNKTKVDSVSVRTDEDYVRALLALFKKRG